MLIGRQSLNWIREYFQVVRPEVIRGLAPIRRRALAIPNAELRAQALDSLKTKQFHCEGGGIFSAPSRDPGGCLFSFVVPYQTLCDYLDTVTDRGPSQDPENLRQLHQALVDAIHPETPLHDYYAHHPSRDDGGYAASLVQDARQSLTQFPGLMSVLGPMQRLVDLYVDLQVYKHGPPHERVSRLTRWYENNAPRQADLSWWEFSAACGSTLGLFALLNLALAPAPSLFEVEEVTGLYFPWIGALHILLDYYVDQEEDDLGGDLNFITYYPSEADAIRGIRRIYRQTLDRAAALADAPFHQYVARGLLGFYLSDRKIRARIAALKLLASGGPLSLGIYVAALVGRSP